MTLVFGLLLCGMFAPLGSVQAQGFTSDNTGLQETAGRAGFTTNLPCRQQPGGCIPAFIGTAVNALLGIFGALFLLLIIWGGIQWMFAQGDTNKVKAAQDTIKNAIIGLVVVAASFAIATYVLDALSEVTGEATGTPV
ncbi:hypothetical protein GF380_00085 [Candidatus Uhrbacteria bacterium]|nr:hypothetical protein [Candidatus Uhrbacteria bacterium]MBD3283823.1 hypothetical protein [Candidatus Uhrbacteria bacterium]